MDDSDERREWWADGLSKRLKRLSWDTTWGRIAEAAMEMADEENAQRVAAVERLTSGRPGYHTITVKALLTAMSEAAEEGEDSGHTSGV